MAFAGRHAFTLLLVFPFIVSPGAPIQARPDAGDTGKEPPGLTTPQELPSELPADVNAHAGGVSLAARITFGAFQHIQVNLDSAGQNIVGDAANEPSLVIDPTRPSRIVIGWRQFDDLASNFRQAGYSYSRNLGWNWARKGYVDPGLRGSDPVLEADADGHIYYQSLRFDVPPAQQFTSLVFRSDDGGRAWSPSVYAYGGDKPWMAIDRTDGLGHNHIYLVWSPVFTEPAGYFFTRSIDEGMSFEAPVTMEARPAIATVAVGPDGTVWIAGIDQRLGAPTPRPLSVAWSADAQDPSATPTFSYTTFYGGGDFVVGDGTTRMPNPGGYHGQIWIDVDRSNGPNAGNLYVVASLDPPGPDPLDVFFMRSVDDGTTWSAPTRVNDDPVDTNAWQWFASLAVAPNGRIDAIWNDTRNSTQPNWSELFYAWSGDGGLTWSTNEQVSPAWNSHVGQPIDGKIGDYYDMESDAVGAHVAWAATFNGEQDVYYTRIGDTDCNANGIGDTVDIAQGTSVDLDENGVPDECELPTSIRMRVEIVREDTILGEEGFVEEFSVNGQLATTHFFYPEGDYIRWFAEKPVGTPYFRPLPAGTYLLKSHGMVVGDSWTGFINEPTIATVVRTETVGIPGRNLDCAVIEQKAQADSDLQATLWFSEDFGFVRYFNYKEGVHGEIHSNHIVGGSGFYPVAVGNWWSSDEPATGVEPGSPTQALLVMSAFPNPTPQTTHISFVLTGPRIARLDVFSVRGELVCTLWHGHLGSGPHEFTWNGIDAKGVPSGAGMYFLRLTAGSQVATKKVLVLR